jgi:hypothetical protein
MGPGKYESVGKSQSVLIMIDPMIFTRTGQARQDGCTALMAAARHTPSRAHLRCMRVLVGAGASLYADIGGVTVLCVVAARAEAARREARAVSWGAHKPSGQRACTRLPRVMSIGIGIAKRGQIAANPEI